MNNSKIKKQIQEISRAKEGLRSPLWLHNFVGKLPLLWRARQLLPPPPSQTAPFHIIHINPLIITIPEDVYEYPKQWKPFFDFFKGREVHFLCRIRWSLEDSNALQLMDYYYNRWMQKNHSSFRFVFLANTAQESELLEQHRLNAIFCNQNCFVDEELHRISTTNKKYDAVYNARPNPFKNFHLAQKIPNLALITYFTSGAEKVYFETLKTELPNAACLNFGGSKLPDCQIQNHKFLNPDGISEALGNAYVGLCLSDREGACYASIEYLLSGLPVVSVSSIGGRDVFFTPNNALIVDKDPDAVREAVLQLKNLNLSPHEIRKAALENINEHRNRFIILLQEILDESGQEISAREVFDKAFINRMYRTRPIKDLYTIAPPLSQ